MRARYRIWVCPEPGCPKIAMKQVDCPEHGKRFCKITVAIQRPPKQPPGAADWARIFADLGAPDA